MEISLADERAFLLRERLTIEEAEKLAWGQKTDAFGRVARVTSLVQRPRDDDFELLYKEHRYQPFWHLRCRARYVYQRRRDYSIPVGGREVETVTIEGMTYQVEEAALVLSGMEHCREELERNLFIDGLDTQADETLEKYLDFPAEEIPAKDLNALAEAGKIVVPPQARASAVVREVLVGMIKSVVADRILEDTVEVQTVDLYYRPVYAFRIRWAEKDRETVIEYDGLTGERETSGRTFQNYMGKILEPEFLFDVGVDTIDLLVPGGGIAIKLARKGIQAVRKKDK
jgi:hypothetical protein